MRKRDWAIGAVLFFVITQFFGGNTGETEYGRPYPDMQQPRSVNLPENTSPPAPSDSGTSNASPTPKQPPTLHASEAEAIRYVSGKRVAFRTGPSTQHPLIDRFDTGRRVFLVEGGDDWARVRDQLTQRDGWIAARFLSTEEKKRDAVEGLNENSGIPDEPVPAISDAVIIQRIIAASLASYPGSCACPYSTDRGGRRCGKRSAYSKPGGYAPICYREDVTKAMIDAVRRQ